MGEIILNVAITLVGIAALAGGITGYGFRRITPWQRGILLLGAFIFLLTDSHPAQIWLQVLAFAACVVIAILNWRKR